MLLNKTLQKHISLNFYLCSPIFLQLLSLTVRDAREVLHTGIFNRLGVLVVDAGHH